MHKKNTTLKVHNFEWSNTVIAEADNGTYDTFSFKFAIPADSPDFINSVLSSVLNIYCDDQDSYHTYEGTWKWDKNKKQYLLSMDSRYWIQGMISYTVETSNGGLIINGGGIYNEFFTRE